MFVWLLHQPASASWLKRELAVSRPDLRFAFSRPGLTTFKTDSPAPVESSFARAWGQSLGRAADVAAIAALLDPLAGPLRLHVFERDLDAPADERASTAGSRARGIEAELRAAFPDRFEASAEAKVGDRVLDVIVAPAEREAEPLFVGTHVHDDTRGPFPGGVAHVAIPEKSPSRAWAKIEEAIRWSGLVPHASETAVEIGSAPGGASYALLERGLTVHGIDPGGMAPIVMRSKRFVHHAKSAADVERRDLPETFEWLASDVNLAPMVALKYIERFVALAHGGLKGAFLTLKVHDDGVFRALPYLRERIAKLGGKRVRITQLPSHRNEVVAIVTFLTIALWKPYGFLSRFTPDGSKWRTLAELGLPKDVWPIGRLDADSEGLLVLSSDKTLVDRLLSPKREHAKTYWVQVERIPDEDALAQLRAGVVLDDKKTAPSVVRRIDEPALPPRDPPVRFRKSVPDCWLELSITEGRNRQVRRMTAAVGHPTLRLVRHAIGRYALRGEPGSVHELGPEDIALLLA